MRENIAEALGYGLVLGFLYFVWPPLVLLGGGLLLWTWANTRPARPSAAPVGRAVGAALGAAYQAWKATRTPVDVGQAEDDTAAAGSAGGDQP